MSRNSILLTKVLKWLLYFILISVGMAFVYSIYRFANSSLLRVQFGLVALLFVFFVIGSLALAHLLVSFIQITQALLKNNIFIRPTVMYLKHIAWDCLIISFCFFLNFVFNLSRSSYEIFKVDLTGIHTDIEYVIFLFAGCFIHILAQVFEQAINYKEDHDLTI